MIEWLKLENVGPAPVMELEFAPRLNIFTGDNGLGKSFLLDVAWYALTHTWPAESNPGLQVGRMVVPPGHSESVIQGRKKIYPNLWASDKRIGESSEFRFDFSRAFRFWKPDNKDAFRVPALVLYAMSDGSFALYEPLRDYNRDNAVNVTITNSNHWKQIALSPSEVWNGLMDSNRNPICEGLIRDWAGWQKEKGDNFDRLTQALAALSPLDQNPIKAGKLTRVSLEDVRDMPTIVMPYGQEVPVVHASSGIRRILTFAYLLVWTWQEHLFACELRGVEPARNIVFLIDEVEAHLHPRWQQTIMRSLLEVVKSLSDEVQVQLLVTTHAPLVMASLESLYDYERDAWFDLDLVLVPGGDPQVQLTKRDFRPYGDASNWLTGEAFNLESSGNVEYGKLMKDASETLNHGSPSPEEIQKIHADLAQKLPPGDPFLFRWRAIAERKGLLKP